MPGALIASDELLHGAVAADQEMRRNPHASNLRVKRVGVEIEPIEKKVRDRRAPPNAGRQANVMYHDQAGRLILRRTFIKIGGWQEDRRVQALADAPIPGCTQPAIRVDFNRLRRHEKRTDERVRHSRNIAIPRAAPRSREYTWRTEHSMPSAPPHPAPRSGSNLAPGIAAQPEVPEALRAAKAAYRPAVLHGHRDARASARRACANFYATTS